MINKISCSLFGVALLLCLAMLYSCTSDIDSPEDALRRIGEEEAAKVGESSSSDDNGYSSSSSSSDYDEFSSSSDDNGDDSSSSDLEPCEEEDDDCEEPSSSSSDEEEPSSSSSEPCEEEDDDCEEPSSSSSDEEEPSSSSEEGESSSSSEEPSSSSTPNPVIGDCVLPIYTCVDETIVASSLVSIENNYERCSSVILLGSSSSGSSLRFTTAHKGNRNISVRVDCGGVIATQTKACKQTFVADRCMEFDHPDEPKYPVSNGSTVIKLTMDWDDRGPNGLGCEYIDNQGKPSIVFSVTTPEGKINASDGNNYWTDRTFPYSGYEQNDNRILFETTLTGLRCTVFYR